MNVLVSYEFSGTWIECSKLSVGVNEHANVCRNASDLTGILSRVYFHLAPSIPGDMW